MNFTTAIHRPRRPRLRASFVVNAAAVATNAFFDTLELHALAAPWMNGAERIGSRSVFPLFVEERRRSWGIA